MKRIMRKILVILILFVMIFEILFSSNVCHASTITDEVINSITNLAGGVVSILYWKEKVFVVGLSFAINTVTANLASSTGVNYGSEGMFNIITPFDIFFNKYKLLDINFFDIEGAPEDSVTRAMRLSISGWYYVMRTVAAAILLCILIYVGIRMALSTVAEEKAKYKKMLFDWIVSLVLIFVLHYIALFVIYANNSIVNVLRILMDGMDKPTDANLIPIEDKMSEIIINIALQSLTGFGIPSMVAVVLYVFIVYQTIAFLVAYLNRMIKIGFLIMISPLISITYSIDKMGDGKAQALGNWLKEFIFTILIQPFHCLMYIAFVRTAFTLITSNGNILSLTSFAKGVDLLISPDYNQLANGVLAILCLLFIKSGEKVIRQIFGFKDNNSATSIAAGMAFGMMAVNNAKKMGATARKGINMAKGGASKLSNAISSDAARGSKAAKFLDDKLNKPINGGLDKLKDWKASNKEAKAQKRAASGKKRKLDKVRTFHEKFTGTRLGKQIGLGNWRVDKALGLMGGAMALASGENFGTAMGTASAIENSSREFFNASKGYISHQNRNQHSAAEQNDMNKLDEAMDALEDLTNNPSKENEKKKEALAKYAEASDNTNKANVLAEQVKQLTEELKKAAKENGDVAGLQAKKANAEQKQKAAEEAAKNAFFAARQADEDGSMEKLYSSINLGDAEDENKNKRSIDDRLEDAKSDKLLQIANFNSREAREKRFNDRSRPPKNEELDAIKTEIISKLTRLKLLQKSDGNTDKSQVLTVDDQESIQSTAEKLMDNITYGVLAGKKFSTGDQAGLIRHGLGLESSGQDSAMQSVCAAAEEFENMQVRAQIAQMHNHHSSLGGDTASLIEHERNHTPYAVSKYAARANQESQRRATETSH